MTTVDGTSRPLRSRQEGLLARYPLTSFFVMAYAFAWIVELPVVLSETGTGESWSGRVRWNTHYVITLGAPGCYHQSNHADEDGAMPRRWTRVAATDGVYRMPCP